MSQPTSVQHEDESADERGHPFPSKHYAPSEYGLDPQNWDIAQDERGLTYVANSDGILQFDGERWRHISTPRNVPARSFAVDSLVYVGIQGDFGYLQPNASGRLYFHSLQEHLPEEERDFKAVWKTHVLSDGIYFQTNKRLFRWDGETMTSWASEERFHTSFVVGDSLYVREMGRGLLRMTNDSLRLVPEGEAFSDTPIYMMAPHPSGDLLLATQNMGLQLYDGTSLRPLAPNLTSYLDEQELYHGSRLPGNRYALATTNRGILVIGPNGEVRRELNKSSGLPDEVVNAVYAGREGQLWAALNNDGVYRTNLNTPTSLHSEKTGLKGTLRSMTRHDGRMYAATGSGLYVLRKNTEKIFGGQRSHFEQRRDISVSWDLLSLEEKLLVAANEGVYQINENESRPVLRGQVYDLLRTENDAPLFVGTRSGITVLKEKKSEWESYSLKGIEDEVHTLASGPDGHLWATLSNRDILRIELSEDYRRATSTVRFDAENGLPAIYKVPTTVDGQLTIRSKQGSFQVENPEEDPDEWQFSARPSLLPDIQGADSLTVKSFYEDENGTLWVALGNRVFTGRKTLDDSGYTWEAVEPLHFEKAAGVGFYPQEDSTIWLTTGKKLIRYAPGSGQMDHQPESEFRAMIRRVTTLRENRTLYGGAARKQEAPPSVSVPYHLNDIRVEAAAPHYRTVNPHQYQFKLAGQEKEWSEWRQEPSFTYTNLWEGEYRIQVRARNERDQVSQIGTLTLDVQPPWYRSGWAYLLYGLGIILLGLAFRRHYQVKREKEQSKAELRQYKDELEALVRERTRELEESEAKFRTLAENALVGTLLLQNGRMQYVNQAFAQMYGYTPQELIGRKYLETLVHPDDRRRIRRLYNECLKGTRKSTEVQYRGLTKEGDTIYVKGFGSRIDFQGKPALIGTEIDVTQRTRLQREVLRVQEEERRRIGQDLHDGVASQLTGVSLMLDTMARTKAEDGIAEQLQEIRDLVVESCEDIRQLSRGLNPTGLSEGDLAAALERLADNNDNCSFEAVGFDTDRDVPSPDDLPYLEDDAAAHLYCIAQEATANARKYAEADQIHIRLNEGEDDLVLTIEDDGRGFNPSEMKKNGSLGLRSMQYRAELLGAELVVDSHPGEGTLIRCRLPQKNP